MSFALGRKSCLLFGWKVWVRRINQAGNNTKTPMPSSETNLILQDQSHQLCTWQQ
jgi:hypothetical protein